MCNVYLCFKLVTSTPMCMIMKLIKLNENLLRNRKLHQGVVYSLQGKHGYIVRGDNRKSIRFYRQDYMNTYKELQLRDGVQFTIEYRKVSLIHSLANDCKVNIRRVDFKFLNTLVILVSISSC